MYGQPRPKKRPKFNSITKRTYPDPVGEAYERLVATQVINQLQQKGLRHTWPKDARYVLSLRIYFRTAQWADASNVLKACEDALNGVLWRDDVLVDIGYVTRHQDYENPRVEMEVRVTGQERKR